jgi:hypothetical protein
MGSLIYNIILSILYYRIRVIRVKQYIIERIGINLLTICNIIVKIYIFSNMNNIGIILRHSFCDI